MPAATAARRVRWQITCSCRPAATLSFHLKELKTADVIGGERHGRSLVYRARFERMSEPLAFLSVDCCAGLARIADRA